MKIDKEVSNTYNSTVLAIDIGVDMLFINIFKLLLIKLSTVTLNITEFTSV